MSNKLTREVKYLQESDRPKKAEPLSFTEWCDNQQISATFLFANVGISAINERVKEYATYLQEFNAGENPIELEFFFSTLDGLEKNIHKIYDDDIIVYLGNCKYDGDVFSVKSKDSIIRFYSGKLNSGRY